MITVSCVLSGDDDDSTKNSKFFENLISHIKKFHLNVIFPNIYETCSKRKDKTFYDIERRTYFFFVPRIFKPSLPIYTIDTMYCNSLYTSTLLIH